MSVSRVRHRGEAPRDVDHGPSNGASGSLRTLGPTAEVARIAQAEASRLVEVGGRMPDGGAGAIERSMASEAQRAAWRAADEAGPRPGAPDGITEAERRRIGRQRGGQVNRVMATTGLPLREARAIVDRPPLIRIADPPVTREEPVMATDQPSAPLDRRLTDLAHAAEEASEAWTELQAAEARWEAAAAALRASWADASIVPVETQPAPAAPEPAPALEPPVSFPRGGHSQELVDDAPEIVTRRPDAAPAAGGGPEARARAAATKNSRLSGQQQRILDATVKHRGDRQAAALEVGVSPSNVNVTLHAIGAKGLLPIELIPQLPAGFAKYTGV